MKLSKTQFFKIVQSRGSRLLKSFLKTELSLMKNLLKLLAKSILITLGLTPTASAADAAFQKKIRDSETTSKILNKGMEVIMKIVKYLEEYGLLLVYC